MIFVVICVVSLILFHNKTGFFNVVSCPTHERNCDKDPSIQSEVESYHDRMRDCEVVFIWPL